MSVREIYNRDYPHPFPLRNLLLVENAIRRVTNNYCVWEGNDRISKEARGYLLTSFTINSNVY